MTSKTTFKSAIAAVAMVATVSQVQAETDFNTLAGVEAEPMNAQEMDAVQGKAFVFDQFGNLADIYGNVFRYEWATNLHVGPDGKYYRYDGVDLLGNFNKVVNGVAYGHLWDSQFNYWDGGYCCTPAPQVTPQSIIQQADNLLGNLPGLLGAVGINLP